MDKVKAQATQLAQQTKEAAQEGKAKLDQAQANRRGDAMLRQLGAVVLAERTGRGAADNQAKIDRLITDISAYERENGLNLTADPAQQPGAAPQPTFPPDPPSPFPGGTPNAYGQSPFPAPGQTSFPDAGPAAPEGTGQSFFPPPSPSGFPDAGQPPAPESGGTSAFPPES
jgi:hypothetical protein